MGQRYFQRSKQLQNLTWLWASGEKIYGFELDWLKENRRSKDLWNGTLVATHVRKIYIKERTIDRLWPTAENQIEK